MATIYKRALSGFTATRGFTAIWSWLSRGHSEHSAFSNSPQDKVMSSQDKALHDEKRQDKALRDEKQHDKALRSEKRQDKVMCDEKRHNDKWRMVTSLFVALFIVAPLLSGCIGKKRGGISNTRYVARDVSTLYRAAQERLERRQYRVSAALFDEVERQHPYSPWARRAQLMSSFSHYMGRNYPQAVESSRRFLSIHPGNKDAPYAHYLIALSYYEQIGDIRKDQRTTLLAKNAFSELVRRYPDTQYAADSLLKLDLINDHLAGKEMEVGRYYQRTAAWIAASTRFRKVVDEYQTTSHIPEALYRLTECYLVLGIADEAQKSAAVLGANYPGSKWYARSYELMQRYGANA